MVQPAVGGGVVEKSISSIEGNGFYLYREQRVVDLKKS